MRQKKNWLVVGLLGLLGHRHYAVTTIKLGTGMLLCGFLFGQIALANTTDASSQIEVFSRDINAYTIFINEKKVGETPLMFNNVQPGSYYLKATTGKTAVYEEVIRITDKQVTTIVVPPLLDQATQNMGNDERQKKAEPLDDYSSKVLSGPYLNIGYHSASYYYYGSWDSPDNVDKNGSALGLGLGYKWGLVPHIDLALGIDRAEFGGWYTMPITASFYYNVPFGDEKKAKSYYGIGYGYTFTNLSRVSGAQMSLLYGFEYPSDKDAVTFDYIVSSGKVNEVSTFQFVLKIGYRWNFKNEQKKRENINADI